jgi:mono/diheme cytochrome c family protein/glucose/arabinose dehydrogenase
MNLQKPVVLALVLVSTLHGAEPPKPTDAAAEGFPSMPPIKALSPADTLKTFQVPKGYRMEVVLAEPDIREPVVAAFDANGRMFVAEMRTYMQDADGTDEHAPTSRVSLHWSSKRDGNFDKHTVFADNLLLPRMILPLGPGQLLINETDTQDIYLYTDTDGDGKSDKKTLWFEGGPRGGNLEHQQSGLIWGMDNWLYMTYNNWRLRWQPGAAAPLKEPIGANGGQWGLTQDDYGKPWIVNAGGEIGPLNFQTHVLYGGFNLKNQFSEDYAQVWPLVGIADVQGGDKRFRPEDKTLNHFTATCGAEVFRGDRLPADLRGDLLFSEPVGRLVRRTKAEVKDGLTYLKNAYDKSEFVRSTDPLSRVVNMNTAPDGTLYMVDMYRGIIQEGNWVKPDSYLRKVVNQYSLDKQFALGRIWRLVHDDFKPGPQPHLYEASVAELVSTLEHPNGWWRDTAQKLLVLRQDKSAVPALTKLAEGATVPLTRIHALWTLEGLGAVDAALVRSKMKDADAQVRAAAIRVSETLYKAGDVSLFADVLAMGKDADGSVALQALCSARLLNANEAKPLVQASVSGLSGHVGMKEIAMQMLAPKRSWGKEFSADQKALLTKGNEIFNELCFACHNPDGRGTPIDGKPGVTLAPALAGSRTVNGNKEAFLAVLLKGLAGPVAGKTYDSQMVPMESNDDQWIAAVASYVRNSFGNKSTTVTPKEVTALRASLKLRTAPFTIAELGEFGPAKLGNQKAWKLTGSHNVAALGMAVDGNLGTRYDTRTAQAPGMWVAVEFPEETLVSGIVLDAGASGGDFPRGYKVELSVDGTTWEKPVAEGKGEKALSEITFAPAKAKAIRVTQTGDSKGSFWSIHELEILAGKSVVAAQ